MHCDRMNLETYKQTKSIAPCGEGKGNSSLHAAKWRGNELLQRFVVAVKQLC